MTCFNNPATCERIIYAVLCHLNGKLERSPSPSNYTLDVTLPQTSAAVTVCMPGASA